MRNHEFVGLKELDDFLAERSKLGETVTPWFQLMKDSGLLHSWWSKLEEKGTFPLEADKIINFM